MNDGAQMGVSGRGKAGDRFMNRDDEWLRGMLERYRELLALTDDARLIELLEEMIRRTEECLADGTA